MIKVNVDTPANTLKFKNVPLYAIVALCFEGETELGIKIDDNLMSWKNEELYCVDSDEVVTLVNLMVTEPKCTPPVLDICGMDFSQDV